MPGLAPACCQKTRHEPSTEGASLGHQTSTSDGDRMRDICSYRWPDVPRAVMLWSCRVEDIRSSAQCQSSACGLIAHHVIMLRCSISRIPR
jgi:hypothetical protein